MARSARDLQEGALLERILQEGTCSRGGTLLEGALPEGALQEGTPGGHSLGGYPPGCRVGQAEPQIRPKPAKLAA